MFLFVCSVPAVGQPVSHHGGVHHPNHPHPHAASQPTGTHQQTIHQAQAQSQVNMFSIWQYAKKF